MNILNYSLILISFFLLFILFLNFKRKTPIINIELIKNFESFIIVQDFYMKKSYDIIYRDKILIYSLETMKPNKEVINDCTKEFIKLTLKFLGPRLVNDFIYFYGDKKSFYFNLTEYFQTRLEDDEIRKSATSNLMNSEDIDEQ